MGRRAEQADAPALGNGLRDENGAKQKDAGHAQLIDVAAECLRFPFPAAIRSLPVAVRLIVEIGFAVLLPADFEDGFVQPGIGQDKEDLQRLAPCRFEDLPAFLELPDPLCQRPREPCEGLRAPVAEPR